MTSTVRSLAPDGPHSLEERGDGLFPAPVHGVWLVLLVGALLIAQILDGMDLNALSFVGAVVRKDLALTHAMFGACIGAASLGTAVGAVLFGAIADRFGRRRTLLLVVLLFGCGALATSQVKNVTELLVMRSLTGVALGGLLPISSAILLGNIATAARLTTVTIICAGSAGGTMLAGFVSSSVVPHFGWRAMFIVGGLAPLVIAPLLLLTVPSDRKTGSVIRSAGGAQMGHGRSDGAFLFRGGAWPLTLVLWAAMFIGAFPVFVSVGWLPSLAAAKGASLAQAAVSLSVFSIGGALGGIVAGSLADRFGYRVILPMAFAGAIATALLGMSIGGASTILIAGAAGFFVVGLLNLMGALVGKAYPDTIRGLAIGASLAVMRIGAAVAPWAAGKLLDLGGGAHLLFLLCAAAGVISGLVFMIAARLPRADNAL
jgi:MFS family permease